MQERARAKCLKLMVGHILHYHPAVAEVRRRMASGQLGVIRAIYSQRCSPRPARGASGPWWSLATHDISLAALLLEDAVTSVSVTKGTDGQREWAVGQLEFGRGKLHRVRVESGGLRSDRRTLVFGSRATALLDEGPSPCQVSIMPPVDIQPKSVEQALRGMAHRRAADERIAVRGQSLALEVHAFVTAVLDDVRVSTDASEGCRVVAALSAGEDSAADGGRLVVPTYAAPLNHLARSEGL
jgi:UDP-2-acetamido-3-amino-2,3-dideoxy-glucuronate N-acetyltransferase